MPTRDVAIGYCRPEDVDGMFFDSVTTMMLYDAKHANRIGALIGAEGGARVHLARNDIVRRFLETDCRWLLWLDADMVVPADTIDALCRAAKEMKFDMVGGLCFAGGRTTIKPTIYRIYRNGKGELRSECKIGYPAQSLVHMDVPGEILATGAACLLTHRSVYEAIAAVPEWGNSPHPWFQDLVIDGADFSEDMVFCLRAAKVGKQLAIHTGVKVGHRKKRELDEALFQDWYARGLHERPDLFGDDDAGGEPMTPEQFANTGVRV